MFSRLFDTANPVAEYQPLPLEDQEASSTAFNRLPKDVLITIAGHIARQGDWKDVIAFFLTNKRTFETFNDKDKLGSITVTIQPRKNEANYYWGYVDQQEPWDVVLKNVNYVLLANYFQDIRLDELRREHTALKKKTDNRECIALGIGIAVGTLCGAAVGAGLGYECHTVIAPACIHHPETVSKCCECCNSPGCTMAGKIVFEDILCCLPCTFLGFSLPVLATSCISNVSINSDRARIADLELQSRKIEMRMDHYNIHRHKANQRVGIFHINNKTREKRLLNSSQASMPERIAMENDEEISQLPPRVMMM